MLGTCRALALVEGLALDVEEEVMVLLNLVLLVLLEGIACLLQFCCLYQMYRFRVEEFILCSLSALLAICNLETRIPRLFFFK